MDDAFKTEADKPFVLKEGNTVETAMYNRIAVLNRVNFLVRAKVKEFDIRTKSPEYTKALDMEMWKRFYSEKPTEPVSEDFCQKMAQVCIESELGIPIQEPVVREIPVAPVETTLYERKSVLAKIGSAILNIGKKK